MRSLDEWCFEFAVASPAPIGKAVADALMEEAVDWAESHQLGIGGGYRPTTDLADAATEWRSRFGLCVTEEGLLIPEPQAAGLLATLRGWCEARGLVLTGGFRPFTPED